jgi:hypothetical protein
MTVLRNLACCLAVLLAAPAAAAADYRALDEVFPGEEYIAVAGSEVFAGVTTDERKGLIAYGLAGGMRTLLPLGREGGAAVDATPQALIAATSRGPWFGPPSGPLTLIPDDVSGLAATGSTVLTLEGRRKNPALVARDLATGAVPKLIARPRGWPTELRAAGPYVAVVINHEREDSAIVVYEIATAREVYRLATGPVNGYDLGPDGRIVLAADTRGRVPIQTATPADPQLRTIARLRVLPYVALGGDMIALAEPGAVSRMILLALDGTSQAVSGPIGRVTSLAYDGTSLAFIAGHCLYGGSGPAGPATDDGCFDEAPRANRFRVKGRRAIVPVKCRVPPGAHCRGTLRLIFGERMVLARRRLNLTAGEYVIRLRIKRRHLGKARGRNAYLDVASPSTSS